MSAAATAMTSSTSTYTTPAFWERLWRMSGINFVTFAIVAWIVYPTQPQVGAPADALLAFYSGERTRILIAAIIAGLSILNLMWFAAALRTTLAEVRQDGWGTAAIAAAGAAGAMLLFLVSMSAGLSYSIADTGSQGFVSGMNDLLWSCVVLTSFPRAMLVMSSAFGLWRARLISNSLFGAGVAVVVLGVLGGTTWLRSGFWAPDGGYSRVVWPVLGLLWILVVSRVLLTRSPATKAAW